MAPTAHREFSTEQALAVAEELEIDLEAATFGLEDFRRGMQVELEHGRHDPETNVTDDDPIVTGKIAWAHLKERPDYYELLEELEAAPARTR
jgi:hypothetical protein